MSCLGFRRRYRPTSTPAGVAGVHMGGRYLQVSLRDDGDDVIVSAYCLRTRQENYVRVRATDPFFLELKAKYGDSLARNLWRHLKMHDSRFGGFSLEWK